MNNNSLLQKAILAKFKQDKTPVNIYLVNGVKLYGIIADYDESTVLLEGVIEQLIFKHAISTILQRENC